MFVGRMAEVNAMEAALFQTRAGQPKNFMVTGERGIGKTSLLDYIRWVAQGEIVADDENLKFLVASTDIEAGTTAESLTRKIERELQRQLAKTDKARAFMKDAWSFIQRIEAAGVKLREADAQDTELLLDDFAYSIAKTTNRICDPSAVTEGFSAQYDGVLILVDECDKASPALGLGAFLKLLVERVQRHGCERFMLGIAGLDNLREVLHSSHESSLRLFDELRLDRLDPKDVNAVVDACLRKANKTNVEQTSITDDGRALLVALSEGYPHFIQQLGYCAFEKDDDRSIDSADVRDGAVGPRGAIERIGDRYYRDDFYNKIQKDSYRQVLRIMSDHLDRWITKKEIKSEFSGKGSTLDNAIHALRTRNIIQSKEGARGVYRLQNKAFALWIKLYTVDPKTLDSAAANDESA